MDDNHGKLPLAGVRIVDFSWYASGPYCTLMLGMLGAEVIRIESRNKPDSHRKNHPMYGRDYVAPYDQLLSSRLSASLNLKHPRAKDVVSGLVAKSEVVVENYRPGVMSRLGLSYENLREVRDDLVMLSLSTAGGTGPDSRMAGYAPAFAALAGLGGANGYPDGPPLELRNSMDHACGLAGALAVLAALRKRARSGQGSHIDLANREVAAVLMGHVFTEYGMTGIEPPRYGNRSPYAAPHNVYRCRGRDRWVSIVAATDAQWLALSAAMDHLAWCADARFSDVHGRKTHEDELDAHIAEWTEQLDPYEVTLRCQARGVAAFPVMSGRDLVENAHLRARGMVFTMTRPGQDDRIALNGPWQFSGSPVGNRRWSPSVGQDNDYVYGELLGMAPEERRRLEEDQLFH